MALLPYYDQAYLDKALLNNGAETRAAAVDPTFDDKYNPIVAQRRGSNPPGTPNSDCYGLRTEPFNECAYFLDILQRDNRITAYYGLVVQNLTSPNFSQAFVVGVARSIYYQAIGLDVIIKSLVKSVGKAVGMGC